MDDRRFDSLVKALAGGQSRRSVLKGFLGFGGAAVAGATLLDADTQAARRPTPTPKPPSCPGQQTYVGGQCVCQVPPAPGTEKCGPDCCNPAGVGAAHSECCDQACCFGYCYGEELCCPTGRTFCEATGECCPVDQPYCCGAAGCCATRCCEAAAGTTCCEEPTPKCCPEDICVAAGGCCSVADCGPGNCWSCVNHVCVPDESKCAGCTDCVQGTCTPNDQNCADADPCTRSTCGTNGQCTPQVFDCRLPGCSCSSQGCNVSICNQSTGQCGEPVPTCSAACCEAINPDRGCLSNARCNEQPTESSDSVQINGLCWYDVFCQDNCCATYVDQDYVCRSDICFIPEED